MKDAFMETKNEGLDLKKNTANLHPSQREHTVEFILARLDRCCVHECVIKLD